MERTAVFGPLGVEHRLPHQRICVVFRVKPPAGSTRSVFLFLGRMAGGAWRSLVREAAVRSERSRFRRPDRAGSGWVESGEVVVVTPPVCGLSQLALNGSVSVADLLQLVSMLAQSGVDVLAAS